MSKCVRRTEQLTLQTKSTNFHIQAYYFALKDCQALLNGSTLNCQLLHCYRESNRVADALANVGVTQAENLMQYDSPPPDIYDVLREDFVGVAWP